jgi:phosphoenolpyruvate-protein kinase (PTS system EI component)
MMVEVPSAALLAERLAPATDFFSVGTNDLAQYALAVDRTNPDVAALYRPLHPAILRMVRLVVEAGRAYSRPVAVCGELAADPIGTAVLVGLGILDLSVTPVAIAGVKDTLSGIDSARARALAEKALVAAEAAEVEKLFRGRP